MSKLRNTFRSVCSGGERSRRCETRISAVDGLRHVRKPRPKLVTNAPIRCNTYRGTLHRHRQYSRLGLSRIETFDRFLGDALDRDAVKLPTITLSFTFIGSPTIDLDQGQSPPAGKLLLGSCR